MLLLLALAQVTLAQAYALRPDFATVRSQKSMSETVQSG